MTPTTFKPKFMQILLGRQYKWFYLFRFEVMGRTTSYFDSLIFVFGHFLVVITTILTWWIAYGKGFSPDFVEKLQYFLMGEIIFASIYQFPSFYGFQILNGAHVKTLLYPTGFLNNIFFRYYGGSFLQNISKLVILLSICVFGWYAGLFKDSLQLWYLVFIWLFSLQIFFYIETLIALVAFFLNQINGIVFNAGFLIVFLSGKSIPLDMLVSSFELNLLNPFAYLFYHPTMMALGKYSIGECVAVIASSICWVFLLKKATHRVLEIGLKRNEAVGL